MRFELLEQQNRVQGDLFAQEEEMNNEEKDKETVNNKLTAKEIEELYKDDNNTSEEIESIHSWLYQKENIYTHQENASKNLSNAKPKPWQPLYCTRCLRYGHIAEKCRG